MNEAARNLKVGDLPIGDLADVLNEMLENLRAEMDLKIHEVSMRMAAQTMAQVETWAATATARLDAKIASMAAFKYCGVWKDGDRYLPGNFVTFSGSLWHANKQTTDRPGTSDSWSLAVKRGKDMR